MKLSTVFAAFLVVVSASPLESRQADETLQPWTVDFLSAAATGNRPPRYPWSYINANITDPNTIVMHTKSDGTKVTVAPNKAQNCRGQYASGQGYGRLFPCDPTGNGFWTIELVEVSGGSPIANFILRVTRTIEIMYTDVEDGQTVGRIASRKFQGEGRFQTGDNLQYNCAASGSGCSASLRETSKPFYITQKEIS